MQHLFKNQQISRNKPIIIFMVVICMSFASCSETYTPKPRAYFRIEFPAHQYQTFDENIPYRFEIPQYSLMVKDTSAMAEPYWYNLSFPSMKGNLHLSYKKIKGNLANYIEDSRTLAYKHTIKADAISEQVFVNKEDKVYGILYEIKGNAASPYQFFATDSANHFIRGSLYFYVYPNKDSLAPVFDFIKLDITHLIETIQWNPNR